jgi:transcriptional regulator with XRE-family HTH domain
MDCLEKIDMLMKENGINKHVLAKKAGIPYTTIVGLYERGVENARLSTLFKLSNFFGVPLDYLVVDKYESPHDFSPNGKELPLYAETEQETELLKLYRKLNSSGKKMATSTLLAFSGNPELTQEKSIEETA